MQYEDLMQLGVGVVFGLAAAPHCLVMCSGIASTLALAGAQGREPDRSTAIVRGLVSNGGRIFSYSIAGALVGGIGVAAFAWLDASLANIVLRWLAAIVLSVAGLSLAGILPAMVLRYPNRLVTRLAGTGRRSGGSASGCGALFGAGALWGFMPCAMAYSALFYAMISGSWFRGMLTMAGFGVGTLFAMLLPALGVSLLSRYRDRARLKIVLGLLLAAVGVVGTLNAVHDFGVWCRA